MAVPLMCVAFDLFAGPSKRQIVIAGAKQAPDTQALVNAAYSTYDPDKIVCPEGFLPPPNPSQFRRLVPRISFALLNSFESMALF